MRQPTFGAGSDNLPSTSGANDAAAARQLLPSTRVERRNEYRLRILAALALAGLSAGCHSAKSGAPSVYEHDVAEFSIRFQYPADLYVVRFDREPGDVPVLSIVLVENQPMNVSYINGSTTEPMEAPPMMTIDVYENPEALTAETWLQERTNWGSGALDVGTEYAGGKEYLGYRWDGLYAGKSAILVDHGYLLVLSVSWVSDSDRLPEVFDSILTNLELTPH